VNDHTRKKQQEEKYVNIKNISNELLAACVHLSGYLRYKNSVLSTVIKNVPPQDYLYQIIQLQYRGALKYDFA